MNCPSCYYENTENAKFCRRCGVQFTVSTDTVTVASSPGEIQRQQIPNQSGPEGVGWRSALPSTQASTTAQGRDSNVSGYGNASGKMSGIVNGYKEQSLSTGTNQQLNIRTFRVDSYDSAGNLVESIPVEMRGFLFTGDIRDGDMVEIEGDRVEGAVVTPSEIFNRRTNVMVRAKGIGEIWSATLDASGPSRGKVKGITIAFVGLFLLFVIGFISFAAHIGSFNPSTAVQCAALQSEVEMDTNTLSDLKRMAVELANAGGSPAQQQTMASEIQAAEERLSEAQTKLATCGK